MFFILVSTWGLGCNDVCVFALIAEGEPISSHRLLVPPFQLPTLDGIRKMIEVLLQLESAPMLLVLFASVATHMRQIHPGTVSEIPAIAKKQMELCEQTLHFLHIIGATTTAHGELSLSDVGYSLAQKLNLPTSSAHTHTTKKLLYINPDYTVLIPREGLLSKEYYMLLSRMELSKDDVIIHAKITHRSILNAYKRGMHVDEFIEVLELLSKTPLPQNLSFMLKEWSKQAIEVHISQTIIIKANHSSFLDELQAGKLQHAITERLTPTIAIIRKDSIDDIVKFARRKDAIIRLFE
jgi:hypothetical protein